MDQWKHGSCILTGFWIFCFEAGHSNRHVMNSSAHSGMADVGHHQAQQKGHLLAYQSSCKEVDFSCLQLIVPSSPNNFISSTALLLIQK